MMVLDAPLWGWRSTGEALSRGVIPCTYEDDRSIKKAPSAIINIRAHSMFLQAFVF